MTYQIIEKTFRDTSTKHKLTLHFLVYKGLTLKPVALESFDLPSPMATCVLLETSNKAKVENAYYSYRRVLSEKQFTDWTIANGGNAETAKEAYSRFPRVMCPVKNKPIKSTNIEVLAQLAEAKADRKVLKQYDKARPKIVHAQFEQSRKALMYRTECRSVRIHTVLAKKIAQAYFAYGKNAREYFADILADCEGTLNFKSRMNVGTLAKAIEKRLATGRFGFNRLLAWRYSAFVMPTVAELPTHVNKILCARTALSNCLPDCFDEYVCRLE